MTKLTRAYKLDEVISQLATHLHVPPNAATCVEINCVSVATKSSVMTRPCCIWYSGWAPTPSRRRVDGMEDDGTIQHERAVKF